MFSTPSTSKRTHGNSCGRARNWIARCGSTPTSFGTPAGTSKYWLGHRRTMATIRSRGSGLTAVGNFTADSSGTS